MRGVRIELARVGAVETALVAGELDHRALHAETQPEEGHLMASREAGRLDLALDPAEAEPAGDHDAVEIAQAPLGEEPFGVVGGDPVDLHRGFARVAAVLQRFDHRQVGVGQVHVLADQADAHRLGGGLDPRDEGAPRVEVGLVVAELEHVAHVVVEAFVVQHERDLVERRRVDARHDGRPRARRTAARSSPSAGSGSAGRSDTRSRRAGYRGCAAR